MEFISTCQEETTQIGHNIAKTLQPGDIITLTGNLGAGKTTLTKAIGEGLGLTQDMPSPTFTIMNVYTLHNQPIKTLVHIDTYRLEHEEDLIDIGIEEYLNDAQAITIIEWPEKTQTLLQNKKTIAITIESPEKNKRIITVASSMPQTIQ